MVDYLVDGYTKKSLQLTDCSLITAIFSAERAIGPNILHPPIDSSRTHIPNTESSRKYYLFIHGIGVTLG